MVKIIDDIMILRLLSYKPMQKLWEFFERWARHGTSKWHASIKIVIFFNIHIPSSGKFEGWIGKSLNARDKSILQSNAPSPIWWRYGRIWSCSLLIGCGIFDYQRILFILRLARLLTAPLPAWACLRLIGFRRSWLPGLGLWGIGVHLACMARWLALSLTILNML